MVWVSSVYIILLYAVALSVSSLVIIGMLNRDVPGSLGFTGFMIAGFAWAWGAALSANSPTPATAELFGEYMRYTGIAFVAPFFLIFCLEYTAGIKRLEIERAFLLSVLPLATLFFIWTRANHQLFIFDAKYEVVGVAILRTAWSRGPAFWVHSVYSYSLVVVGIGLLFTYMLRSSYPYRQQARLLVIGSLIPLLANIPTTLGLIPSGFSLSPLGLGAMIIIFGRALFGFRLLNIAPVAREVIFTGMADIGIVLDSANRIIDINPAVTSILGWQRDRVIGQPIVDILREEDKHLVERYGNLKEAQAEIVIRERSFDMHISPLINDRGKYVGRLIVLRDVTERAQLITDLNAYAHTVAHDLKNPLGMVLGYADFLEQDLQGKLDTDQQEHLQIIAHTAQKMGSIIDELLLLASVRDMSSVPIAELDMLAIVEGARGRMARQLKEKQARVIVPQQWPSAAGYAPWVEEIWANYISNALKYGGKPPIIELGADEYTGSVRFWVKDNGSGMNEEERAALFAEFSRLEQHRNTAEGHGLGLSISQRIAEKLGGSVGVESEVGQGSRFYFQLPASEG